MVVKKDKDENNSQFIWRICSDKDDGLIDLNWKDLALLMNKELFENEEDYVDESALRKQYQAAKKYFNDVFKYKLSNDSLKELDDKKLEIKKERYKLSAVNAERNKYTRKESRQELFYENIKGAIEKYPSVALDYDINNLEEYDMSYILTIADIHAGAEFVSENNMYSLEICKNRFETLLEETIKFVSDNNLSHIRILELGDSVQGILRLSDIKLNETTIVESTIFVARLISDFLNELSKHCVISYYHVPTSNHTQIRPLGSSRNELGADDVEYIIGNYIKDVLVDNARVIVNLYDNSEYATFKIFEYNVIAMHGHQVRNIDSSLKDLSMLHKKFYDIVFLAHFHGSKEINVGECMASDSEVIVCPSFIGSDPYSDSLFRGSKASCKIYGISECYGHTTTYKIVLN